MWPGRSTYDAICLGIINDVGANSIPLRKLATCRFGWWGLSRRSCLEVDVTYSRENLCKRLTQQHYQYNTPWQDVSTTLDGDSGSGSGETTTDEMDREYQIIVSTAECLSAFTSPRRYGVSDWNRWSGRHCGTWWNTHDDAEITAEAYWSLTGPAAKRGFHKQEVTFNRPGRCCDDAWNESGGNVSCHSSTYVATCYFACCRRL